MWRVFETMVREDCFDDTPPKSGYIHPQYKESDANDETLPKEALFQGNEFDERIKEKINSEMGPNIHSIQKNLNINSGYGPQTHNPSQEESFMRFSRPELSGNNSPLK